MTMVPTSQDFDRIYRNRQRPTVLDRIEAEAIGDPEISDLNCTGVLTRSDREHIKECLKRSAPGEIPARTLLDLGCGVGRFGSWMAVELGMSLVGIDFSEVAISIAEKLRSNFDTPGARFYVRAFDATGLETSSVGAAMSLDALYLAAEPDAALQELNRILTPGAPLVFTFYLGPRNRTDWPTLVEDAGMNLLSMLDITRGWRQRMTDKHRQRWKQRDNIREELGVGAEAELSVTAAMLGIEGRQPYISSTSRFLLHAIRK